MKRIIMAVVFLIFFFFAVFIFMPYQKIYRSFINELAYKSSANVSYNITKASLIRLKLKDIKIAMPDKTINIDRCNVSINPFTLLFGSNFAKITVYMGNQKGFFKIGRSKNRYFINGTFKTSMLPSFLDEKLTVFIKGFKGKDRLSVTLSYEKNKIIINQLKVTGDFELTAKGYIKSGVLRLIGVIKIGKIKEAFSL